MTAGWQFRPPWWAILGTVIGCAVTIRLGFWQWHRGVAREALDAQYLSAEAATRPIARCVSTRRCQTVPTQRWSTVKRFATTVPDSCCSTIRFTTARPAIRC